MDLVSLRGRKIQAGPRSWPPAGPEMQVCSSVPSAREPPSLTAHTCTSQGHAHGAEGGQSPARPATLVQHSVTHGHVPQCPWMQESGDHVP